MPAAKRSGIQTSADGNSYIPSSTRADGSTRKEIRVRPGYKPPEDVETYKSRSAEAWRSRGTGAIPGSEIIDASVEVEEGKSKNAKRREAAKRKKEAEAEKVLGDDVSTTMERLDLDKRENKSYEQPASAAMENDEAEAERQKKIRNSLKKLRAVRELKAKRTAGEKLSHEQIVKISKEDELLRDLKKLDYDGEELSNPGTES